MTKFRLHMGLFIFLAFLICACTSAGPGSTPSSTNVPFLDPTNTAIPADTRIPTPASPLSIPTATYLIKPSLTITQRVPSVSSSPTASVTRLLPSATNTPELLASPTSTPFPTIVPNENVQQSCLAVERELPIDGTFKGVLILNRKENTCLLDLQTQKQQVLPTASNGDFEKWDFTVSPDGKWFAYIEIYSDTSGHYQSHQLKLVTADGQQQVIPNWKELWSTIIGWLDNQRLALTLREHDDGTVIVLNPFTGQSQELKPTFNDIKNDDPVLWYTTPRFPEAIYDSTLTRVAYLSLGNTYRLWDAQSRNVLWQRYAHVPSSRPEWSPDQERVAVVAETTRDRFELFSIDRDGKETQLTDMDVAYPDVFSTWVGAFNWSPDGHQITFWLNISQGDYWDANWRLETVDTSTKQVVDYCIVSSRRSGYQTPIWSPDGRYLAVNSDIYGVVLIDVQQNRIFKIGNEDLVIGWMTSE
jgi:hypothetical protein